MTEPVTDGGDGVVRGGFVVMRSGLISLILWFVWDLQLIKL